MAETIEHSLHVLLKKRFGFDSFKGNQEAIIENVLSGKDTFVIMPTGGGQCAISYLRSSKKVLPSSYHH